MTLAFRLAAAALLALSGAAPALAQAQPAASAVPSAGTSVPIRIGSRAVMIIREPFGSISVKERAAVIQSRLDQVLMHHPYLKAEAVRVSREGGAPTITWGPFTIGSADDAHARANSFSSADLLAEAWANNLRLAIREFVAAKQLPARALYRNERDSDYVYRRTDRTHERPSDLKNTKYVFSPNDFVWGAGSTEQSQQGFVVFTKKDAANPPQQIYLGNSAGTFTEYQWISPEDN